MDDLDYKILSCLKENARASATKICGKVHTSVSTVIERTKMMEKAGLIRGYTFLPDQKRLGWELTAFIYVCIDHKYTEGFVRAIRANRHVAECHSLAGDYDFLLKILTRRDRSMEEVLETVIRIPGVSLIKPLVVISTKKCEVSLLNGK